MLVSLIAVTGCDFMRKTAGRPTKEEIAAMKDEMNRIELLREEEARLRASLDSLEVTRQMVQDSIDEIRKNKQVENRKVVEDRTKYLTKNLENRFYIIIGAFQTLENAQALMAKADRHGYSPVLIGCRNGLIGVGVCPVDEYSDALVALQILRKEKFCPKDIWIYRNY